jgi:aldose 1-epimerase
LPLDGVRHVLDRNEGPNHLREGTYGFDRLVWAAATERDEDHKEQPASEACKLD